MKKQVRIIVTGIVQGVSFRRCTQMTARQLGVHGWVRNLPAGAVEGCFEGDTAAVDSLVEWCRTGPPGSRVDTLTCSEHPGSGEFTSFDIRY